MLWRIVELIRQQALRYAETAPATGDLLAVKGDRVHRVGVAGSSDGGLLYRRSSDPQGLAWGPAAVLDVVAADPGSPVEGQLWVVVP